MAYSKRRHYVEVEIQASENFTWGERTPIPFRYNEGWSGDPLPWKMLVVFLWSSKNVSEHHFKSYNYQLCLRSFHSIITNRPIVLHYVI